MNTYSNSSGDKDLGCLLKEANEKLTVAIENLDCGRAPPSANVESSSSVSATIPTTTTNNNSLNYAPPQEDPDDLAAAFFARQQAKNNNNKLQIDAWAKTIHAHRSVPRNLVERNHHDERLTLQEPGKPVPIIDESLVDRLYEEFQNGLQAS